MRNLNLKLSLVIGLSIGFVVCGHLTPKPVPMHSAAVTGTFPSLLMKPGSVPLAPILLTSTLIEDSPSIPSNTSSALPVTTPIQDLVTPSDNHQLLMNNAGIDPSQHASAEQLVQRESSWNPTAYNAEGACSLVQSLPCSKIQGDWTDPVTALTWGNTYVLARYGSWDAALAHSLAFDYY